MLLYFQEQFSFRLQDVNAFMHANYGPTNEITDS
jgi:hypothetical protein